MKLAFGEREGEKKFQRKTERESIVWRDQTKIAQIKIEMLMNESLNSHAVVSLLLFLDFLINEIKKQPKRKRNWSLRSWMGFGDCRRATRH